MTWRPGTYVTAPASYRFKPASAPCRFVQRKPLIQGLIGAVIVTAVTLVLPDPYRLPLLAGLLWLTVGIYVGMGAMHGDRHLRLQALAGLPVMALALLSLWSPWALAVGWLAHPVWDLLHHWGVVKTHVHPSTVGFCIVFDVLIAGLVVALAAGWL